MRASVVLRAASGPRVGAGHVRRSRALARSLVELGASVRFVVDDEESARALARDGFRAAPAGREPGWAGEGATVAWIDGQGDFSPELLRLGCAGARTFLVENRTQARHFADRVVYPALHWEADEWDVAHPDRVLAGAAWIPLDPEVEATPRAAREERDVDLLVSFGGSDPAGLTERVLELLPPERARRLVVSVGWHMGARAERIAALAARFPGARVLAPGAPLASWMAQSRAALTALGTTLYELAYLGTPAWILANYAADRPALAFYAAHGPHRPIGVAGELDDAALARALATVGIAGEPRAVPGLGGGAGRLALALLSGEGRREGAA